MIKVAVFDFDGVIVDSNHAKEAAFYRLFDGNEKIPRAVVRDVVRRNVGTRFDILRDIFVLAGVPAERISPMVQEHAERFDASVQEWIAKQGLAPGAAETLQELKQRMRLYINSATPEDALHATVKNLGIADRFHGIHGAPSTKEENLRAILGREGIEPTEAVVIGDGEGDWNSAKATGAHFIAVASGFHDWSAYTDGFPVISGISEARDIVAKIS